MQTKLVLDLMFCLYIDFMLHAPIYIICHSRELVLVHTFVDYDFEATWFVSGNRCNLLVNLQAIDNYLLALDMIGSCPVDAMTNSLRLSISWDLSTVYFTMATLLQDYAPISSHAQQKVILRFCMSDFDVVVLIIHALHIMSEACFNSFYFNRFRKSVRKDLIVF